MNNEGLHLFLFTVGEKVTQKTLDSIRAFTPKPYRLTIWYDACGRKIDWNFYDQLANQCDDIVLLSQNHGITEAVGFALLYHHAEFIMLVFADNVLLPGYYDRLMEPFLNHPNLISAGHSYKPLKTAYELSNLDNFPDGAQMIRRDYLDEVGGISPAFRIYGHELTEFYYRALSLGFDVAACKDILNGTFEAHEGRDQLDDKEHIIDHNSRTLLSMQRLGFGSYPWWSRTVMEDSIV